ncbi:restriction endonuclease subunit S [Cupriavidus sp. SIMBA_020]|uniref:restriction endonuclease subunit S n=1 Tax=Cupriavidus sp. SIMBA_020 TaxID=3085766 RepID=UPI00397ADA69
MSERTLTDIATINPPLTRTPKLGELVSFVSMSGVSEGGGITESSELPFDTVNSGFTRFQNGDVLFAKITPCMENGKGALAESLTGGVGCGSTEFHVLRATQASVPGYLYQLMQWKQTRQTAEIFMSGSAGQQRVQSDFFSRYKVYAPALPVQRKIATILSSIDTAIEKTEALIAKCQQIKAGLMRDLFTRGVLPNGQLRPPREQAPELYQETAIGWIPKEWQYELLDKLALRGSGHTPNKNFPEYWNGGIKWVSLADSHRLDQLYISDTELQISHKGIQNSSAVLHPAGIVVLSRDAGVGKSAITTEPMAVSQHFMCWKCDQKMDNHFLYYWLQFNKRTFENIAMGSTILTIGLPYFKKMKIACPIEMEEQRNIAAKIKASDTRIFSLQDELSKLKQQKQGLMHDLLTSKVPVKIEEPEVVDG